MMRKNEALLMVGALLLAVFIKIALLKAGVIPFNSDEAIVALMARHINQGARPIFFYGQAYMGSLDAWLVALAFRLLGEQVDSIRFVQILLYLLYILTTWLLARRLFSDPKIANIAIWIAAVPTVLMTTYTTATLGGYGEILVLGNIILILGYEVTVGQLRVSRTSWGALGLLGGIAFWILGIAGVYLLPIALLGLWKFSKKEVSCYIVAALGFIIGSIPWWYYNFTHSGEALAVLTGKSTLSLVATSPIFRLSGLILLGLPTLLGFRFPWSPDYSPLPVLFLWILLYIGMLWYLYRGITRRELRLKTNAGMLFGLFILVFLLIFVGTHYGIDATGRYLLPLNTILVLSLSLLVIAVWRWRKNIGYLLLVTILLLNGFETVRAARSTDSITTQFDPITRFDNSSDYELISFLQEQNEVRGYSNYWVSYRLAFLSDENLIFSARLPYKPDLSYTRADNRYPLYDEMVRKSSKVAYITSKHPELDRMIWRGLDSMNVSFSEVQIGDYHIFFNLSKAVKPEELDLK